MDLATIIGLVLGFGALVGAHVIESTTELPVFFYGLGSITAFMIVYGGTTAALLVTFPLEVFLKVFPAVKNVFIYKEETNAVEIVDTFTRLSEKARREGLLSLEEEEGALSDEFLKKGIGLVVDGQDPELIRSVLEIDLEQMEERHNDGVKILKAAGGYSPTMGIIGTVMGLITVLSHLSDPSQLGPKVAVAFAATLYGVATANIVYLPMSEKLKTRSETEVMHRTMMLEGILAVQAGDNPRIIKEKLEGFLSPSVRRRRAAMGEGQALEAGVR